jgi:hypothetical protein
MVLSLLGLPVPWITDLPRLGFGDQAEIREADIPEKRKKALLDKIADFESELTKRRVNLAAVMAVIALVSSAIHDNAETLIESPKIVHAISAIFGAAKAEEDEATPKLPKPEPFKAIPDFRQKPSKAAGATIDRQSSHSWIMPSGMTPAKEAAHLPAARHHVAIA